MEGLDEQRQSIVLELYCRKAEREKVEREREAGHGHVERGAQKESSTARDESKKGKSLKRERRG